MRFTASFSDALTLTKGKTKLFCLFSILLIPCSFFTFFFQLYLFEFGLCAFLPLNFFSFFFYLFLPWLFTMYCSRWHTIIIHMAYIKKSFSEIFVFIRFHSRFFIISFALSIAAQNEIFLDVCDILHYTHKKEANNDTRKYRFFFIIQTYVICFQSAIIKSFPLNVVYGGVRCIFQRRLSFYSMTYFCFLAWIVERINIEKKCFTE